MDVHAMRAMLPCLPCMAENPRDQHQLLLKQLLNRGPSLQPDNLIVTKLADGYQTITYRQHQEEVRKLASALDRFGGNFGTRVGSMMWNNAWHTQLYHATACMGLVLHTANLRLGAKDLSYCIKHAEDKIMFVDADLVKLIAAVDGPVLDSIDLFVVAGEDGTPGKYVLPEQIPTARTRDYAEFVSTGNSVFQWPDFKETTLHAICYTSGTTGHPKAAGYSHRSTYLHTLAAVGADALGLKGSHVVLPFVPMFHVLSWGVPFMALMLGTRMVMNHRFMDPTSLLQCFVDWEVQISTGVPVVWQGLKAVIEKMGVEEVRKKLKIQMLTCGGSTPPVSLMEWFRKQLDIEFLQGWGMTETNPIGLMGREIAKYQDLTRTPKQLMANVAKAGLPMPGFEIRIANAENLDEDMPRNQPGELLCRGPWVIGAYFNEDAPEKFHRGWLITGDVAKIDEEGAVILTDRSKDVIKSGGEWISSIDMENHITGMPEVAQAAVVAAYHPKWEERPVAIVKLRPEDAGSASTNLLQKLRSHCESNFAKMQLPDDVLVWDAIPMTGSGKIDKKLIRQRLKEQGYQLPGLVPEVASLS